MTRFKFVCNRDHFCVIIYGMEFSIVANLCSDWFATRPIAKLFGIGCPKFGVWFNLYGVN